MSLFHRITPILCALLAVGSNVRGQSQGAWPSPVDLAANWTSFRGPAFGIVSANTPTEWDGASGRNILWKSPVPMAGKNSPIIWRDSIFLSGATKEAQEVFCFDANTGVLRWQKRVGNPDPAEAPKIMEDTGYAASTMTTDGRLVFAIFVTGDLFALDFSGNIVWSKQFGLPDNQYGHASSLVMWQDRLIVLLDQGLEPDSGKSKLIALEATTGKPLWDVNRPVANSWTSPIVIATPGGPQIITVANPWVIAYEPAGGKELWRVKCLHGDVAPSPAYANGLVFAAMENSVGAAIKVSGSGDVTKTHTAWEAEADLPDIVSPLITEKFAFLVVTYGTVSCHDTATGKRLWKHEFDGPFHASPILIGNVVHLIDRKGVMHRFEAATEFKLLNTSPLGEAVSATPAVVNDRIYIRGQNHLFCIGLK